MGGWMWTYPLYGQSQLMLWSSWAVTVEQVQRGHILLILNWNTEINTCLMQYKLHTTIKTIIILIIKSHKVHNCLISSVSLQIQFFYSNPRLYKREGIQTFHIWSILASWPPIPRRLWNVLFITLISLCFKKIQWTLNYFFHVLFKQHLLNYLSYLLLSQCIKIPNTNYHERNSFIFQVYWQPDSLTAGC